jgi:hypothetical protein
MTLISLLVVLLVLTMAGVAQAATPQDIYDDYAADGKLDGTYTDAELEAYLNDAVIHGYPNAIVDDLDKIIRELLTPPYDDPSSRDKFPFTGFQMLMAGLAAAVLVGGGVALRLKVSR